MKAITIREALQKVADNPILDPDADQTQLPCYELVCRHLFDIANNPNASQRGSMTRANRARQMILNRLVGKRRSGSHPATRNPINLEFIDLTGGEIES